MSPSAAEAFGMPSPEERSRPRTKKPRLNVVEEGSAEDFGDFVDVTGAVDEDLVEDAPEPQEQELDPEQQLREAEEKLRNDRTVDEHISAAALANATAQIARETFATMHAPYEGAWELLAQLRSFEIELDEAMATAMERPNLQMNMPRAQEERRALTQALKHTQDALQEIRTKVESATPADEEEATEEAHRRAIAKEMEPVSDRDLEEIVDKAFAPYIAEDAEEIATDLEYEGNLDAIAYKPEAKPVPSVPESESAPLEAKPIPLMPASDELLSIPADIHATQAKYEHIADYTRGIHARLEQHPTSAEQKNFDQNLVHLEVMYSELNERLRMLDRYPQPQHAEAAKERELLFEAMRMIEDARHRIKEYEFPEEPAPENIPIPLTRTKKPTKTTSPKKEGLAMHRYGGHWEDFVSNVKGMIDTFRPRMQKRRAKDRARAEEQAEREEEVLKNIRGAKKMMEVIELQSEPGDLTFLPRDYALAAGELQQELSAKKKVKKRITEAMNKLISMNEELAEHPNQIFVQPGIDLVEKAQWELKKPPKPARKKPKKS